MRASESFRNGRYFCAKPLKKTRTRQIIYAIDRGPNKSRPKCEKPERVVNMLTHVTIKPQNIGIITSGWDGCVSLNRRKPIVNAITGPGAIPKRGYSGKTRPIRIPIIG